MSGNKSPQLSRTLLSILADHTSAVVGMVLILLLIFSTSSLFSRTLGIVPRAPTTIAFTVTHISHNFSALWQDTSIYLSFCLLLFSYRSSVDQQNLLNDKFFFLLNQFLVIYFYYNWLVSLSWQGIENNVWQCLI